MIVSLTIYVDLLIFTLSLCWSPIDDMVIFSRVFSNVVLAPWATSSSFAGKRLHHFPHRLRFRPRERDKTLSPHYKVAVGSSFTGDLNHRRDVRYIGLLQVSAYSSAVPSAGAWSSVLSHMLLLLIGRYLVRVTYVAFTAANLPRQNAVK